MRAVQKIEQKAEPEDDYDDFFPNGIPLPNKFCDKPRAGIEWLVKTYVGGNYKKVIDEYLKMFPGLKGTYKKHKRKGVIPIVQLYLLMSMPEMRQELLENSANNKPLSFERLIIKKLYNIYPRKPYDSNELRQKLPCWSDIQTQTYHLKYDNDRDALMLMITLWESLDDMASMSEAVRFDHIMGIFFLSSLVGNKYFLDACVLHNPSIAKDLTGIMDGESFLDRSSKMTEYKVSQDCPLLLHAGKPHLTKMHYIDSVVFEMVTNIYDPEELNESSLWPALIIQKRLMSVAAYYDTHSDEIHKIKREEYRFEIDQFTKKINTLLENSDALGTLTAKRIITNIAAIGSLACKADVSKTMLSIDILLTLMSEPLKDSLSDGISENKSIDDLQKEIISLVGEDVLGNAARISEATGVLQKASEDREKVIQTIDQTLIKTKSEIEQSLNAHDKMSLVPQNSAQDQAEQKLAASTEKVLSLEHTVVGQREEIRQLKQTKHHAQEPSPMQHGTAQAELSAILTAMAPAAEFMTPQQILTVFQKLLPEEQVVVLPSAFESTKRSAKFNQPRRLFELLQTLVIDYRQDLCNGLPDGQARHRLGGAYHANESETVEKSRNLRRTRTFAYEGKNIPFYKHLSIGIAKNDTSTLRVHFEWDSKKQRIVVAYVGPHLPTASE